jgi:hypothetical protein
MCVHVSSVCMYVLYVCMYVCVYVVTSDLVVKLADLGEARDVSSANETAKFMPRYYYS